MRKWPRESGSSRKGAEVRRVTTDEAVRVIRSGDGAEVQLINTHLGLDRRERLVQVEALLGPEWLGHPSCRDPAIVLGDFNAVPRSRAYERLAARLQDAQRSHTAQRPRPTFPARFPFLRIDHVFVSRSIEARGAGRLRSPATYH